MTSRGRSIAFICAAAVLAFAVLMLGLGRSQDDLEPPQADLRALASVLLLATPGVLGLIGAWTRRPTVVVAAGVICLLQSVVAFSGVTLVYLLPAVGFLRAATHDERSPGRPPRRALFVIAVVIAVPLAVGIVLVTGILGVLLLAIVGGVASSLSRSGSTQRVRAVAAVQGVAIVALVVGAWLATFAATETACWVGRTEPGGAIAWEQIPVTNTLTLEAGVTVSTCVSGIPTLGAVLAATALVAAAIVVAALPIRSLPGPLNARVALP